MKKKFTLLLLLTISISGNLYSQWFQQNSGTNVTLNSIHLVDTNIVYIAGNSGVVLKTTNGGVNWILMNTGIMIELRSVFFVNKDTGFVSGYGGVILKTTNGGLNWDITYLGNYYHIHNIQFTSIDTGYIVVQATCGYYPCVAVYKTINSGNNWINPPYAITGTSNDMYFVNSNTGFYNIDNALRFTNNGGASWNFISIPDNFFLSNIFNFIGSDSGWISVYNSGNTIRRILKTIDGGHSWSTVFESTSFSIGDGFFVSPDVGFSTDYSNQGMILKTYNGGSNWVTQFNTGEYFTRISFNNQTTGYAIGSGGLILKTTNGGEPLGIQNIGSNIPVKFNLSQNYPNPFNPITKIKFDLAKSSLTRLIIYDILGREIATLVNEQLKPGSYEVEWDGSNYASGIYFYRLIANDYVETKKMLILK